MQIFRVALDNRNTFRGQCFGKVLWFGLEDAIQPSSFPVCFKPRLGAGFGNKIGTPFWTLPLVPLFAEKACRKFG
jgi:hypothetical protein